MHHIYHEFYLRPGGLIPSREGVLEWGKIVQQPFRNVTDRDINRLQLVTENSACLER